MKFWSSLLLFSTIILACVPAEEIILTEINTDIQNEDFRKVFAYQDKQQLDSILAFTSSADPTYRFQTASALASFQDISSLDSLEALLLDINPIIQTAAAYAIGQLGNARGESALFKALVMVDTISNNTLLNQTILEAIGKCGSAEFLDPLASVSTYQIKDDKLLLGQALGIYRFMLRGIVSEQGTKKMIEMATDRSFPNEARVMAANYLSRAKEISITENKFQMTNLMQKDPDYRIRMSLASALRHTEDEDVLESLISSLDTEKDYRVRINIIKALKSFPYINTIEKVLETLQDENLHVAKAAAEFLEVEGKPADASLYRSYVKDNMHWSVKAKVLGSIIKFLPRNYANTRFKINGELQTLYKTSENIYEKVACVDALASDVVNYKLIYDLAFADPSPVVRSSVMNGLNKILSSPSFSNAFRTKSSQTRIKKDVLQYLKAGVESGDIGVVTSAASTIASTNLGLHEVDYDFTFLDDAIAKLQLPKDTEAKYALEESKANIAGVTYTKSPPVYNHPIEWTALNEISDSTLIRLITNKGNIIFKLFANQTPGTIANFVQLTKGRYFDNKTFHRVVSAFVIQGGCPIGDGSGSLDYTIRSEVPQIYYNKAGMVGMASAGPHTEGVQFFITHAPAPHLDGRYTIFGEVVEGMDVVNDIHEGDTITDVRIESI